MKTRRLIAPWGLALAMLGLLLIGLAWTTPTSADSADPPDTTDLLARWMPVTEDKMATVSDKKAGKRADAAAISALTERIVIDGVFGGDLIDGDGTVTTGTGSAEPLTFVEQKLFDAADVVYYEDLDGSGAAGAGDAYWIDDGDGVFSSTLDAVIVGSPTEGVAGTLVDGLAGETAVAYNDAEIADNNRYDDGEDIYLVDSHAEFMGAMQRTIYDPFRPGEVLAHIYIANTTNTVYMHNDFIVDAASIWVDDGITNGVAGTQTDIGFQPFTNTISSTLHVQLFGRWFATDDDVYWKSTGPYTDTWATGDSLWLDGNDDGVYSSSVDSLLVSTGALADGDEGRELNSDGPTPTYNFIYDDVNGNELWDVGEPIGTHDGDEIYDWNYFDDRWSWLVDGDGAASITRGVESEVHIDGNTWFQASDAVYHWDADGNGDWNEGDGLWVDDGDGVFSDAVDGVLVRGSMPNDAQGKLLQVQLVDGDGTDTEGLGDENVTRYGQTPFARSDNVLWYDVEDDDNWFWSDGDGLWIDRDGNSVFDEGVDDVLVRGSMTGGEMGQRLSASAHHFGYDDGEVVLNGRYDPGEDIYAANTYLAYDDFELNFNGAYDDGEDIYDRDYIEIWVYAEGDAAQVPTDMYHPDLEPNLRDVGFRVHVNGIRVDDADDDYDAPTGFRAAAGWGRSRGAPAAFVPAGGYNRHYEYQLQSASADAPTHLVSGGNRMDEAAPTSPAAPRIWSTDHKIDWETCEITWVTHWKDLRRGNDNYQGFGSSSGQREESVFWDWIHPPPPPPPPLPPPVPPVVVKEPLFGPLIVDSENPFGRYCWSIFIRNPNTQTMGRIDLRDQLPEGWQGDVVHVTTRPPTVTLELDRNPISPSIVLTDGLPDGGWVEIIICAFRELITDTDVLTNVVSGTADHDDDPATDAIPIAPTESTTPVVYEPTMQLRKVPEKSEVVAGQAVGWRVGVENTGLIPLEGASLTDSDSSGAEQTLPLGTLPRGAARTVRVETTVDESASVSDTVTNTVTLVGEYTDSANATRPHSTSVSATAHVTACQVCIQGTVSFTDCTRPASQAPLESVTVNVQQNGAAVDTVTTDEDGHYEYCFSVPPDTTDGYSLEVMLQEGDDKFRVRNGDGGDVPTATTPGFDVPTCPPNPRVVQQDINFTDPANASNVLANRRQALAAMYHDTETAADYWEDEHDVNLPGGGPDVVGYSPYGTSYWPSNPPTTTRTIHINTADSPCNSNNRPMNREWHEFAHYVDDLIDGLPPYPDVRNHGGILNSDSSDSVVEGWAEFWSSKVAVSETYTDPHEYRVGGSRMNLELTHNPKHTFVYSGTLYGSEEWAVAGLLWDLHDDNQDGLRVRTVVTNPNPPPTNTVQWVTYTDYISLTNHRIYQIMTSHTVTTVRGLYNALAAEGVGQGDSDGDGTSDLDELFINHGFWSDDCDWVLDRDEDVGWATQVRGANDPRPSYVLIDGAYLELGVLRAGERVSETTLHVQIDFHPPYTNQGLDYGYTEWLSRGLPTLYYFLAPLTNPYTTTAEVWVTKGVSESDRLLIHNWAYWAAVNPTDTHVLSHDFCLGGDVYDVDCDGQVSMADVDDLGCRFGAFPDLDYRPRYDLDGDGDVDEGDYQLLLAQVVTVTLTADPGSIPIDGSTSLLTATVEDEFGTPVADGTIVSFTTSLGSLGGQGSLLLPAMTVNGAATTTLTSGSEVGTAIITATVATRSATTTVEFTGEYTVYLPLVLRNASSTDLTGRGPYLPSTLRNQR